MRRKRRWRTWSVKDVLVYGSLLVLLVEPFFVAFVSGAILPGFFGLLVFGWWCFSYADVTS